jgi:hypothetical protein
MKRLMSLVLAACALVTLGGCVYGPGYYQRPGVVYDDGATVGYDDYGYAPAYGYGYGYGYAYDPWYYGYGYGPWLGLGFSGRYYFGGHHFGGHDGGHRGDWHGSGDHGSHSSHHGH